MVVDVDSVRDFLADVLQMRDGAEISTFRSATEALEVFAATPEKFQLVITDLQMPGMNGTEFCRRLRAVTPDLKVVLATGNGAKQTAFSGCSPGPFPPPMSGVWWKRREAFPKPQIQTRAYDFQPSSRRNSGEMTFTNKPNRPKKMKTKTKVILSVLTLGASALMLTAQSTGNHPRPLRGEEGGGPGGPGHRAPPPVIAVLDANHDDVIDATEIANASKALLALDKNGDGQLTIDELRPPRPEGDAGGPPPEGAPGAN